MAMLVVCIKVFWNELLIVIYKQNWGTGLKQTDDQQTDQNWPITDYKLDASLTANDIIT